MLVKDLFKKVEMLNKLNEEFGIEDKKQISFYDLEFKQFNSFKEFKKFINDEYVKEVIESLLNTNLVALEKNIYTVSFDWVSISGMSNYVSFKFIVE